MPYARRREGYALGVGGGRGTFAWGVEPNQGRLSEGVGAYWVDPSVQLPCLRQSPTKSNHLRGVGRRDDADQCVKYALQKRLVAYQCQCVPACANHFRARTDGGAGGVGGWERSGLGPCACPRSSGHLGTVPPGGCGGGCPSRRRGINDSCSHTNACAGPSSSQIQGLRASANSCINISGPAPGCAFWYHPRFGGSRKIRRQPTDPGGWAGRKLLCGGGGG